MARETQTFLSMYTISSIRQKSLQSINYSFWLINGMNIALLSYTYIYFLFTNFGDVHHISWINDELVNDDEYGEDI